MAPARTPVKSAFLFMVLLRPYPKLRLSLVSCYCLDLRQGHTHVQTAAQEFPDERCRLDPVWPDHGLRRQPYRQPAGEGCILNVVLGIVGACVGGFIFTRIGGMGVTGFNIYSMFVAIVGAIVVLVIYH